MQKRTKHACGETRTLKHYPTSYPLTKQHQSGLNSNKKRASLIQRTSKHQARTEQA